MFSLSSERDSKLVDSPAGANCGGCVFSYDGADTGGKAFCGCGRLGGEDMEAKAGEAV